MSVETNANSESTELPIITGKELQRATYMALAQFVVLGLAALMFQSDLDLLLGGQLNVVILVVAALILIASNMNLICVVSDRADLRGLAALMIESHLRLDEAIGAQLKGVVGDTENAAIMLIMEVRKLSIHNTSVTADIGEILGHIQFQDVVRQRIERMEDAVAKRNMIFQAFARGLDTPDTDLLELPVQMRGVLDEYLSTESRHAPAANNASGQNESLSKFELF